MGAQQTAFAACRWSALLLPLGMMLAGARPADGQNALRIAQKEGTVLIQLGDQPLLEYQAAPKPRKPYVKQWFSPGGVGVLRDAPADHLHHHGVMFAVAVDGVDFWAENAKCGWQKGRPIAAVSTSSSAAQATARFTQPVDWLDPAGEKTLLKEQRTIEAHRLPDVPATLVSWRSELAAPAGKDSVTLSGSPYFGLGARFVASMDTGGQFVHAEGKTGVEATNNARSAWCAYWAVADGKPVTVAMFDDQANARHPATWFTMEKFAYLSATLHLNQQPATIQAGKPLVLRYGLALWDGKADKAQIEQAYRRWLAIGAEK
jgi:hypothetical protein